MSVSATFDETFYLTNNADVVVAISQGFFSSALQHYNLFGGKELRAPNATFDPNYYAINNGDVLNAVSTGVFPNVFAHYQAFGEAENRAPTSAFAGFDAAGYLAANADVAAAVTSGVFSSALDHFIQFGQNESRSGSGVTAATNPGTTFTLTTNTDALTGGTGDDSFVALPTTLTVGDSVDGGAGSDTLSLTANITADASVAGFTLTNLENLNVAVTDGATGSADTLTINALNSSATALQVSGLGATTAEDTIVFNNVAAGTSVGMANATDLNVTANFATAATSGTADSVSVSLNAAGSTAAGDSDLTIGTGFETINVATTGAASTVNDIVTSSATTMNITGDQNLTVRAALDASLDVIDASAFTGQLSIVTANDTTTPDATVSSVDVADLTLTSGSGNDTLNVSANAADNEISVSSGAGDDTVTVGQVLSNSSSTSAGDVVSGGAGDDTLAGDVDLFDALLVSQEQPL